jgi:hypothetical protein
LYYGTNKFNDKNNANEVGSQTRNRGSLQRGSRLRAALTSLEKAS